MSPTALRLDLCDPDTARAVMRRAGFSPQQRLGQHLLVDRRLLETIVGALALRGNEEVLEIGMGIGTLTRELARDAARVVAVDIDPASVRAARITLEGLGNVTVVEGDALRQDPTELGLRPGWVAAGNIPYGLTGALLSHLFEGGLQPARAVLMVQREVARRLAAAPGAWSLATVALRSLASVEQVADAPPRCFLPPPAVHSSVIQLRPRLVMPLAERAAVLGIARMAFQQRRKFLRHGVARSVGGDLAAAERLLAGAGIDPARRPGTLSLEEWRRLARSLGPAPTAVRRARR